MIFVFKIWMYHEQKRNWEVPIYLNYTQCKLYVIWESFLPVTGYYLQRRISGIPCIVIFSGVAQVTVLSSNPHCSWDQGCWTIPCARRPGVNDGYLLFYGNAMASACSELSHHCDTIVPIIGERPAFGSWCCPWTEVGGDEKEVIYVRSGYGRFLKAKRSCVQDV